MTEAHAIAGQGVIDDAGAALNELSALMDAVSAPEIEAAAREIVAGSAIFLSGSGRSGLVARSVAMRLMHIGLRAFAVGEVATPAISKGDVLVVLSARASATATSQLATAKSAGARTILFTTGPRTPLLEDADVVVQIPSRVSVFTAQHAGSLFEQGCLLLGDSMAQHVRLHLDVSEAELDARHANL